MKDILARAKVPQLRNMKVFVDLVKNEMCDHIVRTDDFKSTATQRTGKFKMFF